MEEPAGYKVNYLCLQVVFKVKITNDIIFLCPTPSPDSALAYSISPPSPGLCFSSARDVIELPPPLRSHNIDLCLPSESGFNAGVMLSPVLRRYGVVFSVSSFPVGTVTVENSGPEKRPSFQYSIKTSQSMHGAGIPPRRASLDLIDLCRSRIKEPSLLLKS